MSALTLVPGWEYITSDNIVKEIWDSLVLHQKQWKSQAHKIPIITFYYKNSDQIGRKCKQSITTHIHICC